MTPNLRLTLVALATGTTLLLSPAHASPQDTACGAAARAFHALGRFPNYDDFLAEHGECAAYADHVAYYRQWPKPDPLPLVRGDWHLVVQTDLGSDATALRFRADGGGLVAVVSDGAILRLDMDGAVLGSAPLGEGQSGIIASDIDPSGGRVVLADETRIEDGGILVLDAATGEVILSTRYDGTAGLAFDTRGQWIAINPQADSGFITMNSHSGGVYSGARQRINYGLFTAWANEELALIPVIDGVGLFEIRTRAQVGHVELRSVYDLVFVDAFSVAPDGRRALVASLDTPPLLLDMSLGQVLAELDSQSKGAQGIALSPDGLSAVVGGPSGTVAVWDDTGSLVSELGQMPSEVVRVALSADGRSIAAASSDGSLHIWRVQE